MTKYRIYEIAKELNLDNKKVLGFLADHKITVKNHMSTVEAGVRDMIVKGLKANQGSVKPPRMRPGRSRKKPPRRRRRWLPKWPR